MARSTVHYADKETNNILKKLHNKLRPAGTPVQRVEYIIELLLLRIFEVKLAQDPEFEQLRAAFAGDNETLLFSSLLSLPNEQILPALNARFFPFYARILSEARKVWKGNLSTKVQDQLVLIEEVFGNSNFTNNVTSGNMAEVIGLVTELDSEMLLKTDLLGDTIESALSETGGTKDIGLHRTPDHIRQFMVGLVAPTFQSRLFDPTVGTGGFMFDSFEYVLEGVYHEGRWPGPKAHPELAAWFQRWFDTHPVEVPSLEVTTDFYRTGVGGIEYLGMVRKMAAINFYIRGLNPGNIQQGDALEKFGSEILPASKSIVLANPPFGAERDKESYPNVWSEYPTESETTILFVKLMLETLAPSGVCAVIVSEGFLTWDQNSARALRRALLDECNLQAIISLPQGLFVSKSGQGPKTSILLFVKGPATERVWFYKVVNDGYSMGTHRKPIAGCQLVEALDLFHEYIRQGKEPPESRHSFCIPAEWIKTLDPRSKDRIRSETRADMAAKEADDRAKQLEKWNAQIAAKKLTPAERDERLKQHAELWYGKTENEIARKIERAHLYSFNLPNYRSSLTPAQIEAWHAFAATRVREGTAEHTLEEKYRAIAAARPDELDEMLSSLDPRHSLELDWARQFLAGVPAEEFQRHPHLNTLQEIIASQQKTPRVALGEILKLRREVLPQEHYRGETDIIGKIRFVDGKLFMRQERTAETNLQWSERGDLVISKINFHQGATAVNDAGRILASMDYLIYIVDPTIASPAFLSRILRYPAFLAMLEANKPGGVKGRSQPEFIETLAVPVPSIEEQEEVVRKISRFESLAQGVSLVEDNWTYDNEYFTGPERQLSDIADIGTGSTPSRTNPEYFGGGIKWALTAEVNECDIEMTAETLTEKAIVDYRLRIYPPDTILVAMYGQGATRGKSAYLRVPAAITQNCAGIVVNHPDVLPRYVYYYLRSIYEEIRGQEYSGGGVPHLNLSIISNLRIPIPSLEKQQDVVADLDGESKLIAELRVVKAEAEAAARDTLARIWES
jgi:type I restriction enzyme M protein